MKAVIFDFDGVIVDTEKLRFSALQKVLSQKNILLPDHYFEKMEGRKTTYFLKQEFPELNEKEIEEISETRREEERKNIEKVKILPNVKAVFSFLKENNIRIAICTGSHKSIVQSLLKNNSLEKFVEVLVTGEDFTKNKPFPECYETTLKKLNLPGRDVLVIEDAPAGITAAHEAGCAAYGLATYIPIKEFGENKAFNNLGELLNHLRENHV